MSRTMFVCLLAISVAWLARKSRMTVYALRWEITAIMIETNKDVDLTVATTIMAIIRDAVIF